MEQQMADYRRDDDSENIMIVQDNCTDAMIPEDSMVLNTNCACGQGASGYREDKTSIGFLKQQIQYYLQQLDAERKSRIEAQARVKELEYELTLTNKQLKQFQAQHLGALHQRRMEALNRYKNEYYSDPKNQAKLTGGCLYQADGSGSEGEDEIDGLAFNYKSQCNR